jgi:hypothetical protein
LGSGCSPRSCAHGAFRLLRPRRSDVGCHSQGPRFSKTRHQKRPAETGGGNGVSIAKFRTRRPARICETSRCRADFKQPSYVTRWRRTGWLGSLDSNLEMSLKNIPLKVRTDFHESSRILPRETISRLSCRILLRSRRVSPQRPHSLGRGHPPVPWAIARPSSGPPSWGPAGRPSSSGYRG